MNRTHYISYLNTAKHTTIHAWTNVLSYENVFFSLQTANCEVCFDILFVISLRSVHVSIEMNVLNTQKLHHWKRNIIMVTSRVYTSSMKGRYCMT